MALALYAVYRLLLGWLLCLILETTPTRHALLQMLVATAGSLAGGVGYQLLEGPDVQLSMASTMMALGVSLMLTIVVVGLLRRRPSSPDPDSPDYDSRFDHRI